MDAKPWSQVPGSIPRNSDVPFGRNLGLLLSEVPGVLDMNGLWLVVEGMATVMQKEEI